LRARFFIAREYIFVFVDVDVAIIGGGIVGLACAAALSRAGKSTVTLERHRALGTETTSRSSEVIHAGLYYAPGSLKATMCVRGAQLLYAWCGSRGVAHARCGKIVVATSADEVPRLEALADNARDSGATVERIDAARARALEPNVTCVAALSSPSTGIVDSHAFVASLAAEARAHDGVVAAGRTVTSASRTDRWVLQCDGVAGREEIRAALVVNAAGLYADVVAKLFGATYDQRFVKGTYFRSRRAFVSRLVYPLPHAEGLGVHATVDLAGGVRFGPDTSAAASREDYALDESRRASFGEAVRRYIPSLSDDDLSPDTCGIRAKVATGDFVIERSNDAIHLVGIESPGLTAALAIAERVVMLVS
jgi:L-2-hydroxyglutarate oxidase LhgO